MIDSMPPRHLSPSPQAQPTGTRRTEHLEGTSVSQRSHTGGPSNIISVKFTGNQATDVYHFESSDDDVPLQGQKLAQPVLSSPASAVENSVSSHVLSPAPSTSDRKSPPRRALRARKPEQKMPYTLDLMRHRDQFRRRGLKPVHNLDAQSRVHEDEEQYQADEEEVYLDKNEKYIPPEDVGQRAAKRRRIYVKETLNEDFEIQLRVGRKRFLYPTKFDVPRTIKPTHQVAADREVSSSVYGSLIP